MQKYFQKPVEFFVFLVALTLIYIPKAAIAASVDTMDIVSGWQLRDIVKVTQNGRICPFVACCQAMIALKFP